EWMDRQLSSNGPQIRMRRRSRTERDIEIVNKPESYQLDYKVQTSKRVIRAVKLEAELVNDYRCWLRRQHRKLSQANYGRFQCDGMVYKEGDLFHASLKFTQLNFPGRSSGKPNSIRTPLGVFVLAVITKGDIPSLLKQLFRLRLFRGYLQHVPAKFFPDKIVI